MEKTLKGMYICTGLKQSAFMYRMKLIKKGVLFTIITFLTFSCMTHEEVTDIRQEIENVLVDNILKVWYPTILDTAGGGFYSNFDASWHRMPVQEKFIVTQARGVWTASQAAGLFPGEKHYVQAALHGFKFLKDSMWDRQYGGFDSYHPENMKNELSQYKLAYGNAFAIYALAAYYGISKDTGALELAKKAFYWLDTYSRDNIFGGYYNILMLDGRSVLSPDFSMPGDKYWKINAVYKDYNSSIHLLEAFTELYKVWNDSLLKNRLQEMLTIVRDTMVSQYGYLRLYYQRDWRPVLYADSAENIQFLNLAIDHVSFGHDIETAYLILEASSALGMKDDPVSHKISKKLIDHTLKTGIDHQNSGIYDAGIDVNGHDSILIVTKSKNWWSQSEALNATLLFSRLYPDEPVYWQNFTRLWDYIKDYCIDWQNGDWYIEGLDNSPDARYQPKATIWKGNYHTARALMNCMNLLLNKKTG
jgi:mannobiose 2-epimerase